MKYLIIWGWWDFGLVLKVNKQNRNCDYLFALDIQIGWLNIWTQFYKNNKIWK